MTISSKGKKSSNLQFPNKINRKMVAVEAAGDSSDFKATIVCPICDKPETVSKSTKFLSSGSLGKPFWVISNFDRHIKKKHNRNEQSSLATSRSKTPRDCKNNADDNFPVKRRRTNSVSIDSETDSYENFSENLRDMNNAEEKIVEILDVTVIKGPYEVLYDSTQEFSEEHNSTECSFSGEGVSGLQMGQSGPDSSMPHTDEVSNKNLYDPKEYGVFYC